MNDILKAIAERNSCRDFADTPLTEEQLSTLVDAALAAPSARNLQPWHVIVITDKALIDEMDADGMKVLAAQEDKSSFEQFTARGGKLFYNAPCMFVVVSDGSTYAAIDSGILCQNVVLAAHSLGLGSVICGMARIPLGSSRGAEFKKRLRFPDGYDYTMAVLVGTANSGKEPHEHDMGKITYIK